MLRLVPSVVLIAISFSLTCWFFLFGPCVVMVPKGNLLFLGPLGN